MRSRGRSVRSCWHHDWRASISDALDDPHEWGKIPVLTKEELRKLSTDAFYGDFCIQPLTAAAEFWRSGGSTGKPLFYPRSAEDLDYALGRRIPAHLAVHRGDRG